jgi:hypothetical protein
MPEPTADERAILDVLAASDEPVSLDSAYETLLPPRPRWPRQGGRHAWSGRWMATMRAWVALEQAGMLMRSRDGEHLYEITDAGRAVLTESEGSRNA